MEDVTFPEFVVLMIKTLLSLPGRYIQFMIRPKDIVNWWFTCFFIVIILSVIACIIAGIVASVY